MNKTPFILNDPLYGTERSYNALRLAGSLARRPDPQVQVFLMGDAASCATAKQRVPQGSYNVELMLQGPASRHDVEIAVCGTCMDGRGFSGAELADGTKRGSLSQLTDWTDWNACTAWADETLVL